MQQGVERCVRYGLLPTFTDADRPLPKALFSGSAVPLTPSCMAFWKKILGNNPAPAVDYYDEGRDLLAGGKFHEALTSFRLALKEAPGDAIVLQQIAICYTRIGMVEEAAKTYRHVLQKNPTSPGAHYGLAFILLRGEHPHESIQHLEAFLANAPVDDDAGSHVDHARWTLAQLRGQAHDGAYEADEHVGY